MKPADAARIFDTLDMDVLIEVMGQMKEAKSAPVLAAMSSERAKAVTVLLAQQKKLPDTTSAAGAPSQ
jgi:flagellar motility protein MotE (MotC chaperone)